MSAAYAGTTMPTSRAPKPRNTQLGDWLRAQLRARGWTHQDFADRLGVSQPQVGRWLSGANTPSHDSMQRIADALYVSLDDVLDAAGIRPQVVFDDPRVVELVNMLRAVQPSEDRLGMLRSLLEHMLEYDRQRADAQRRRRKLDGA